VTRTVHVFIVEIKEGRVSGVKGGRRGGKNKCRTQVRASLSSAV
jgi:hypothetical protein